MCAGFQRVFEDNGGQIIQDWPLSATPWPRPHPKKASPVKKDVAQQKNRRSCDAPAFLFAIAASHTLTSGPREAGPFDPPLGPLGFGLRGTVRLRAPGSFSGFGVTRPSTYSKPIFS